MYDDIFVNKRHYFKFVSLIRYLNLCFKSVHRETDLNFTSVQFSNILQSMFLSLLVLHLPSIRI